MKLQNSIPRVTILSRAFTTAALCCAAVLTLPSLAPAGNGNAGNPGVIPPNASPNGHTYAEWSALWWQWALGIPAESSPLLDETGEFAAVGQSGPVWFLAGNFGGTTVRHVTIPAGKKLFLPVINNFWVTTCMGEPRTQDDILPLIAPFIDAAGGLVIEVDGRAVRNLQRYRVDSPLFCTPLDLFGVVTPADLEAAGFCPPGETEPDCSDLPNPEEHFGSFEGFGPGMSDGYWVMLKPLSPGDHTIHIAATSGDFALDVTYRLTVERNPRAHDDD